METETLSRHRADYEANDMAESLLRTVDTSTTRATKVSIFHVLTVASIVGSIALFMRGKKMEAIFVGLWPPTFEALKSAATRR